jgi:hypothetical protein
VTRNRFLECKSTGFKDFLFEESEGRMLGLITLEGF